MKKYSSCFHYYWVIKPIRIFIFGRSRRKWKSGRSDIKVTSTSQNHWVVFQNGTFLMDESHPRSLKSFSTIFTSCLSCYVNSKPFFEIIVVYNFPSQYFSFVLCFIPPVFFQQFEFPHIFHQSPVVFSVLAYIYPNYFVSKISLSNILKNLRGKYLFAVYFGRKDILSSANKFSSKTGRWRW